MNNEEKEKKETFTDVGSIATIAGVGLTISASLAASIVAPPITMGVAAILAGFGAYKKLHESERKEETNEKEEPPSSILTRS